MAIIQQTQTDEQNQQPNNGTVVGGAQGQLITPMASVQTGGGGVGGGARGLTGPAQGGTPEQSSSPTPGVANRAGTFTNLSNYLTANPTAGTNLAGKVSGAINTQNQQAQKAIDTGVDTFNTDVSNATINPNQGLLDQAFANPTSFASDQNNVNSFQNLLNANYAGPTSFENDFNAYNPVQQSVQNAQEFGQQAFTPGGRQTLLSGLNKPGVNQTQGNLALDNFFLQSSPTAMQTITQPNVNLINNLRDAKTNAGQAVTNAQNTTANTAAQTNQALGGAFTNLQNTVNTNVGNLQTQAQTNLDALKTALSHNQTLTPQQVADLGVTPDQWAALQAKAQTLQDQFGISSNLALLGAVNLAGYNPANTPTTPITLPDGQTLGQSLGSGAGGILGNIAGGTAWGGTLLNDSIGGSLGDLGAFAGPLGIIGGDILGSIIGGGDLFSGSNIGGTVGAIAGSFIPIPGGTIIGSVIGSFLGGLFGGGTPSVGPNGSTGIGVDQNGNLVVGASGADNGANVQTTINVANQAVQAINSILKANGLMINPQYNGQMSIPKMAIVQGSAGGDNSGQANSPAGLWYTMMNNGMIVKDPNATPDPNNSLNFSSYVTAQTPNVAINPANTATAQNYSDYAALNKLGNQNNQFLLPQNATQAGTAKPDIADFDYSTALNNVNQDLSTAQSNQLAQQQAALDVLKRGLQG